MRRMLAEWERQRAILLSFPHKNTDWFDIDNEKSLQESLSPFIRIAQAIAYSQAVYIICDDKEYISSLFCSTNNMTFIEIPTNDTWIRDYGYISIFDNQESKLLDFIFDGWGGKFEASLDNRVNQILHKRGYLGTTLLESIDFILEGGSIESDGEETILTTSKCLCNLNRNGGLSKKEIEKKLSQYLGTSRVLWLDYGYLAGDDTDSHIDTLARFVSVDTIVYVDCEDKEDEHYQELYQMREQLKEFKTLDNRPYNLIPLPMTSPIYDKENSRLPSTYANFLITNSAILYPTYSDPKDEEAREIFRAIFPTKEIIPINCLKLIEQGGSLHCSTMGVG